MVNVLGPVMKETLSLIIPFRFGWNGSLKKNKVTLPMQLSLLHVVRPATQPLLKEEDFAHVIS